MTQGIIYVIINKANGHKYVAQSTLPMNKVWQQHIQDSKRMSSKPLHKAFRKYGIDKFMIKEIDECDLSILGEREEYWIKQYKSYGDGGYNEEPVERIVEEKIEEVEAPIEIPLSSHQNNKNYTKKPWSIIAPEHRSTGKHAGLRIQGRNLDTGEIRTWESVRDAAEDVTGDRRKNSNILVSARRCGNCYGYKWKILDEDKTKKKAVFGVHKKTESMGPRFDSIAEARRALGGDGQGTALLKSLRNPGRFSWKGYYWYYG